MRIIRSTGIQTSGQAMAAIIPASLRRKTASRQQGVAAVEFALVALIFFLLFFGIIEIARAMYICNTLQEATRRAAALAANTDFTDTAAMQHVREAALFRNSPGFLVFGQPVSDQNIKIDYLQIPASSTIPVSISGALPASPQQNLLNCALNPNGANCIRLVRVRICLSGGDSNACDPVPYQQLVSLVPFSFPLPRSTTIANAETFGLPPGMPCGC
jgi:hypothetical protein